LVPLFLVQLIPWAPLGSDLAQTLVQLAIPIAYGGALVVWSGQTVGMRAVNIRVVPLAPCSELSVGQGWGRAAYNLPSAIPGVWVGPLLGLIDCCWMLWDRPNRQTLHDRISRTIVVKSLYAR
jgi:uncharacterized RDD family membrane protein YckC